MTALERLSAAIEAGKCCTIPTPHLMAKIHRPDETARIMGYVENYVILRHKGATPFCMTAKDVLGHVRALIAKEGKE